VLSLAVLSLAVVLSPLNSQHALSQAADPPPPGLPQGPPPGGASRWNQQISATQTLNLGGAALQVDFATGALDLTSAQILPWIQRAAQAVTVYYGRFPV